MMGRVKGLVTAVELAHRERRLRGVGPDRRLRERRRSAPVPVAILSAAACRDGDVPTEVFYPMPADDAAADAAKAVCAGCRVRQGCLEYAVGNFEQHGVWGGTTPEERVLIRRAMA